MNELDEVLDLLEQDNPRQGIDRAEELLSEGDLDEEERSKLTYGLAAGSFKVGKYDQALKWLKETDSDKKWMLRGFCYLQRQEPNRAVSSFERSAEELSENKREAQLMAAQSMALNEDYGDAREQLDFLLEQELDDGMRAEIFLNRGLVELEDENFGDALEWLRQTIDKYEESPFAEQAAYHEVVILEKKGQVEPALERLNWLEERTDDTRIQNAITELRSRLMQQKNDRTSQLREYEY